MHGLHGSPSGSSGFGITRTRRAPAPRLAVRRPRRCPGRCRPRPRARLGSREVRARRSPRRTPPGAPGAASRLLHVAAGQFPLPRSRVVVAQRPLQHQHPARVRSEDSEPGHGHFARSLADGEPPAVVEVVRLHRGDGGNSKSRHSPELATGGLEPAERGELGLHGRRACGLPGFVIVAAPFEVVAVQARLGRDARRLRLPWRPASRPASPVSAGIAFGP